MAHSVGQARPAQGGKVTIPWFALGFVAVAGLNSLALLPQGLVSQAVNLNTVLLAMAMAGLGLTTQVSAIRKAGVKPLALAAILFGWLVCGGFFINSIITRARLSLVLAKKSRDRQQGLC